MSKKSSEKRWARKEAHMDGDNYQRGNSGPSDYFSPWHMAKAAAAERAAEPKVAAAYAQHAGNARAASARAAAAAGMAMRKTGGFGLTREAKQAQARAGVAHLRAAQHGISSEYHKQKAAEHAEAAGSEWDESKHPRDENGKFS